MLSPNIVVQLASMCDGYQFIKIVNYYYFKSMRFIGLSCIKVNVIFTYAIK